MNTLLMQSEVSVRVRFKFKLRLSGVCQNEGHANWTNKFGLSLLVVLKHLFFFFFYLLVCCLLSRVRPVFFFIIWLEPFAHLVRRFGTARETVGLVQNSGAMVSILILK